MSEEKELVWIDKELKPKWEVLQDILRLNGKGLDEVIESLKKDDDTLIECLEDNFISIKHHAIKVRDEYKKCVDEQIDKTYKLWEECDNKIAESRTKIKSIESSFSDVNRLIDSMHRKLNDLPLRELDRAMDTIERFNNMSQKDKESIELLLKLDKNN